MADIVNLQNTTPILLQTKSNLTTNPFITNEQKIIEIEVLETQANNIINEAYRKNNINSISDLTLKEILKGISNSFTGFLDDLFTKPQNVGWLNYIIFLFQKDQRYAYFGIILIFISIYMMLISKN